MISFLPRTPSTILWAAFWIFWSLMAAGAEKHVAVKEPLINRLRLLIFEGGAFAALLLPTSAYNPRLLTGQFWMPIGLGIQLLGMALSVWARFHLGRYWSGSVAVKTGHEVVRTGPYSLVRHPIYTGLIIQMLGSSLTFGNIFAFISTFILYLGFKIKATDEESMLRTHLGEEYAQYARTTPALLPRGPFQRPRQLT